MIERIQLVSLHSHYRNRNEFVAVIANGDFHYALHVRGGWPQEVLPISGRVLVTHEHTGWGSYCLKISAPSLGGDAPDLDPICAALRERGWAHSLISLNLNHLELWESRNHFPPVLSKFEDRRDRYYISDVPSERLWGAHPTWCIRVHLGDHNHISVMANVPRIYDDSQALANLLAAIRTLPDADTIPDLHPAQAA